jgi:hypothetical protein
MSICGFVSHSCTRRTDDLQGLLEVRVEEAHPGICMCDDHQLSRNYTSQASRRSSENSGCTAATAEEHEPNCWGLSWADGCPSFKACLPQSTAL